MPIGFAKSSTGEYAGGIFWIVGAAVLFSWIVSGSSRRTSRSRCCQGLRQAPQGARTPIRTTRRSTASCAALIDGALERRWWVIGATAAALALALPAMKLVPQQFFPSSTRPELHRRPAPEGRRVVRRDDRAGQEDGSGAREGRGRQVLHRLHGRRRAALLSLAQPRTAEPGLRPVRRDDEGHGSARTRALAPDGERRRAVPRGVGARLAPRARARRSASRCSSASSVPDTQKVRAIAREVEQVVASSPKVRDVQLDWNDPVRTMKVDLDQDKARALGLSPADVALVTQTVMNGATLSQLREHEDLIDIVARAVPAERLQPRHAEGRQPLHAPRHRRAAVAGRARQVRARRAGAVAAQPRHGDHRARRRARTASRRCP